MNIVKFRFPLLVLAFVLLIIGAILRYKAHPLAWYFIGVAVVLYILARFFIKEKKNNRSA